jgi:hypothetical protein
MEFILSPSSAISAQKKLKIKKLMFGVGWQKACRDKGAPTV